jgi:hypothetical protein
MRETAIPDQLKAKKAFKSPSQWEKLGVVEHVCHPSYNRKLARANNGDPISKITNACLTSTKP